MDVKLRPRDRMYVTAPTGKSEAELDALLFDKVARRNRKDPYEETKYREPESKRSEHGGRAVEIGWKAIEPMVNRLSLISRSC